MIIIKVNSPFGELESEPIDMDPQKALDMIKECEGSIDFKTYDGKIAYIPSGMANMNCIFLIENV